jgi:hypothetical protein
MTTTHWDTDFIAGKDEPRTRAFVDALRREFPEFSIRKKRGNPLQHAIDVALRILTLGGMRTYVTHYHTVLFGTLWIPDGWERMGDLDRYILLRHERIHLLQRRRMGDVKMAFLYLFWFFPVGFAYGRARIEWEAYEETVRATAECLGLETARALKGYICDRFVGPDYAWMWPFPKTVEAWFDELFARIEDELSST